MSLSSVCVFYFFKYLFMFTMSLFLFFFEFFFFKQKTAYEMRISDWSSDVCSSDLFRSDRVGSAHRDFHARRIEIVLQRVTVAQEIKLAGTDAELVETGVALGRRAIAGDLQALRQIGRAHV